MNVNVMMQYVTYGLALIGVLAFLVSIIVQVIKELPGLNKIPTSIVALVTSLILCPVALAVLCTYYKTAVTWYYIFASIIAAFLVSIIVQVIKELPGLNKIPTSIVALVTSLILCPVALAVLCTYYKTAVTWYYIFASIIAAFVVYLVATGGWEKVKGIWDRTKYKDSEGE